MRPRFYVPDLDPAAERVALPADEAGHLARVLRLGVGDEVDVFDGRGGLWRAEIVQADKRSAVVRPLQREDAARETAVPLTLVSSLLKADKMDHVVRDAVMLGVVAIQPVVSDRAELGLAAVARGQRVARWQRIAVASAKQCGRAVVPAVMEPVAFDAYLAQTLMGVRLLCVEPSAEGGLVRAVRAVPRPVAAHVVVGPEGGWGPVEVSSALRVGAIPVSLGARTLRADAVPVVALTAFLTAWGEL